MARTGLRRTIFVLVALICLLAQGRASAAENDQPGEFDYYVLVLSWMPSYCEREGRDRKDGQCSASEPRRFSLHGLWPQYEKGWPEDCPIGKRPFVPAKVIEEMRDVMPSKSLIIHEYRTHGTCSGLEPAQYFGVARELYERVNVPPRFLAPEAARVVSAEEIEREFTDANAWLKPDMIAVSCRGENLLDIRVCFGRDFFPRACGLNEDEKRFCPAGKIAVPQVTP
jgi:ribonuclease T2